MNRSRVTVQNDAGFACSPADRSLIMCDHGLREHKATAEVDAFVAIGNHLKKKQLPVPQIYFHDCFAGLVILEDLGDMHLQTAVRLNPDAEQMSHGISASSQI